MSSATDKYHERTQLLRPTQSTRKCVICEQSKYQLGGKLLHTHSSRVRRWACKGCVEEGAK